jgi:hypothetical protein
MRDNVLGCGIYIREPEEYFEYLFSNKSQIEGELGEELEWKRLPSKKASRIIIEKDFNLDNEAEWTEAISWLLDITEKFYRVFSKYN